MELFHVTRFPWATAGADCAKHSFEPVLCVFAELHRNIKGYPFPALCSDEQKIAIQRTLFGASKRLNLEWSRLDSDEVTMENALASQIIDLSFLYDRDGRKKCYIADGGSTVMTLNDVDHLRFKMFRPGLASVQSLWTDLNAVDETFAKSVEYDVHPKFGYLTAEPQHAGTGVVFSAVLHIPALECEQGGISLEQSMRALGFELLPFYNLPFPIKRDEDVFEANGMPGMEEGMPSKAQRATEGPQPDKDRKNVSKDIPYPEDVFMTDTDMPGAPGGAPIEPGAFHLLRTRVAMGESEDALAARFDACLATIVAEERRAMEREMKRHPDLLMGVCTRDIANLCYGTMHTVQSSLGGTDGLTFAVRMGYLPYDRYPLDLNKLAFRAVSVTRPQLYFTDDDEPNHRQNLRERASDINRYMEDSGVKTALNTSLFSGLPSGKKGTDTGK